MLFGDFPQYMTLDHLQLINIIRHVRHVQDTTPKREKINGEPSEFQYQVAYGPSPTPSEEIVAVKWLYEVFPHMVSV